MSFQFKLIIFLTIFIFSCSHTKEKTESRNFQMQKKRFTPLGHPQSIENLEQLKWHLKITKTEKAWQLSRGDKNIIVAIIDSGVDIHHPDLKDNIWINSVEFKGKKGIDDDNNGFIDDIHGWNFVDNNNKVMDFHGHGTHVAGIIGGQGKICKPGVAPKVSLMVLKYFDPHAQGETNLKNTVQSIKYAIQNGAHIINFSGGGPEPNNEERAAIEWAMEKNILFVTAGGNQYANIEKNPYYPASYNLPNLLSVAASDPEDKHSSFSNKGQSILAHAPGTKIFSTLPFGKCGFLTGTSQSTPIFTGGAVLIKTYKKLDKPAEIIKYLLKTTDFKKHLKGKSQTGGRANFYRALGSEHVDVALNGTRVQYVNDDISHILDENEKVNKDIISILSEISLKKKKRNPASIDNLPKFAVDPSHWTKLFTEY